jgi:hypothetical protein
MTMSSSLDGAAGLIGNNGRNTAEACDTNARQTNANTTARLIFVAMAVFTGARTPFPG